MKATLSIEEIRVEDDCEQPQRITDCDIKAVRQVAAKLGDKR